MSAFMNKRQIVKAYDKGHLDEVKNQLVRYGTIVKLKDWESNHGDLYDGAWRLYHIEHHEMQWKIKMHNGEVKSVSHNYGNPDSCIFGSGLY